MNYINHFKFREKKGQNNFFFKIRVQLPKKIEINMAAGVRRRVAPADDAPAQLCSLLNGCLLYWPY